MKLPDWRLTFWGRIGEFLMRSRTGSELSPDEKALWIQSGLGGIAIDGHVPAVLLGLLPGMGIDW